MNKKCINLITIMTVTSLILALSGCKKQVDTKDCEAQLKEQLVTNLNSKIDDSMGDNEKQLLNSVINKIEISNIQVTENTGSAQIQVPLYNSIIDTVVSDSDFISKYRSLEEIKASDEIVSSNCLMFAELLLDSCESGSVDVNFSITDDKVSADFSQITLLDDLKNNLTTDLINRMSNKETKSFKSITDLKSVPKDCSFQVKYKSDKGSSLIGISINSVLTGSDAITRIAEMSNKNSVDDLSSKNVRVLNYTVTNLSSKSLVFQNAFITVDSSLNIADVSVPILGMKNTGIIKKNKSMDFEVVLISDTKSNLCYYNGDNLVLISEE